MTKRSSQVNLSLVLGDALPVLRMSFYLLRERLVVQGQKPVHSPYLQLPGECGMLLKGPYQPLKSAASA